MNDIVISRYAENLDWITRIPDEFDVHIVNKGARLTAGPVLARAASVTERPNHGRESETFLSHIIAGKGAGESGDFTVFAQGDPFEHSPDIIELLGQWRQWSAVQPLSWRWKSKRDIPPSPILARERGDFIVGLRVRPELFSLATWSPLGFSDPGTQWLETTYAELHGLAPGANIAAHFLRKCRLHALAAEADAHLLGRFTYGALFAARSVRASDIGEEQLALLRSASLGHEVYGYVIERLWLHLFGLPFVLPVALSATPQPVEEPVPDGAFVPPDPRSPRARQIDRVAGRVRRLVASR